MIESIRKLKERYSSVLSHAGLDAEQQSEMQARLNALRLAESVLRKTELNNKLPQHTLQVGILGPTQAGKSTLVNLLLQTNDAGVSPLAGYTVHAQGFASNVSENDLGYLDTIFEDFSRFDTASLDLENYKQYSLDVVDTKLFSDAPPAVLWDSPDFDSIESRGYRPAVLRVAALSDVLILMLSKDKYADRSVWDMLDMLKPLNKPMLVCINKLNPDDSEVVVKSFLQRFSETAKLSEYDIATPAIVTLPYSRGLDDTASQLDPAVKLELQENLKQLLNVVDRKQQLRGAQNFILAHWESWLQPLREEQQAAGQWDREVATAIEDALQEYKDSYLEHPQKYETFNKAIAELLTLLEVPGIAAPLIATRKVVTWPVRKLLGVGQQMLSGDLGQDRAGNRDLEEEALARVLEHAVSKLVNSTLEQSENKPEQQQWWRALNKRLRQQQPVLEGQFAQAVENYQQDFEPEIEKAAQALFKNLQQQPAVLNSLRAARVTTDAAAVALAVHSGGLAASDLVLAPAMLSVTSMLTEGAIGKYMDTVRNDLKERQLATVDSDLMRRLVQTELLALSGKLEDNALFMIPEAELASAEKEVALWQNNKSSATQLPTLKGAGQSGKRADQ